MIDTKINGITFQNWAAACGQLTQGMDETEVINKLGVELPVWQKTMDEFSALLSNPDAIAEYTQIFTNPNQGVFAGDAGTAAAADEWKVIVPDFDTYVSIQSRITSASDSGLDAATVLKDEFGLSIGQWSQAAMAMLKVRSEMDPAEMIATYTKYGMTQDQIDTAADDITL